MTWNTAALTAEGAPKWFQLAEILRRAILNGEFPPGTRMPTEAQLNDTFGVSRTTARAALNKLVQEDLIMRRSGVGSVVLASRVDQPVGKLRGFTQDMRSRGLEPAYETLDAGWSKATGDVAHALDLATGDMPFRSVRLLKANGRIIGYSESWVRPDVFGDTPPPSEHALTTNSLYEWLQRNRGIEITRGVEFIEAQPASRSVAAHLQIPLKTPVLVVTRIAKTLNNMPVEFAAITYRSDRYRFRVDL